MGEGQKKRSKVSGGGGTDRQAGRQTVARQRQTDSRQADRQKDKQAHRDTDRLRADRKTRKTIGRQRGKQAETDSRQASRQTDWHTGRQKPPPGQTDRKAGRQTGFGGVALAAM